MLKKIFYTSKRKKICELLQENQKAEGMATRPTLDQTKEAIFSSLGGYIPDFKVLDVFGGSGALSLESISRGAQLAYIIDENPAAIRIIKENANWYD